MITAIIKISSKSATYRYDVTLLDYRYKYTCTETFFAESLSFMMDVVLFILVLHCLALQGAASQANPGSKGELGVTTVQVQSHSYYIADTVQTIHNCILFFSSCKLYESLPGDCGEQNRWNQLFDFLTKCNSWQGNSTAASEPKNRNQNSIWPFLVARM